ncbi:MULTISPECIES: HAD family hydrolase [unclassified Actinopolyspora]|uniref:HAD family hydrolase n=1 Tax=unclassified Actinopolyspora TaxID=2639451 RepID=UPI0013F684CE|nr:MULTISPECIES: HAD family hydrolase [unclassified Actinopolyspora]NHD17378.1 HAD family hydrolase [Actinopolyspora sp. BKK2]NHE76889.1 HAD family hydrolase [Actinopolyspora sp. BKK1]
MNESSSSPTADHIVWDWNGTLLADNHAVVAAVNVVCSAFGAEHVDLYRWRSVFGRPLRHAYEKVLGREIAQRDWARIDRIYHEAYRELLHTCELAADAPEVLLGWWNAGRSQSLLSMFFHEELVPLVESFGLSSVFSRVDGLRDPAVGGSKAEHLVAHLGALGVDPSEAVVVGDVADDASAAEWAGAGCVLVSTGVMSRESLEATGRPVVDSLGEAVERLAGARVL